MTTFYFLIAMIVLYAVLQVVALYVLTGVRWRLAFGVAIPAAACVIVGIIGVIAGASMAPLYFMLFAPIGAGCLAVILASHVLANLPKR